MNEYRNAIYSDIERRYGHQKIENYDMEDKKILSKKSKLFKLKSKD